MGEEDIPAMVERILAETSGDCKKVSILASGHSSVMASFMLDTFPVQTSDWIS